MTKDNHLLGTFTVEGIAPAPRGQPQIEVTFELDVNGVLTVRAEDKGSGKAEQVTITSDKGRLSDEEIQRMLKEAEAMADEDKKVKAQVTARNELEHLAYGVRGQSRDDKVKAQLGDQDAKVVENAAQEALDWLDSNPKATKEEYDERKQDLEKIIHPIFSKLQGGAGAGSDEMPDHDDL